MGSENKEDLSKGSNRSRASSISHTDANNDPEVHAHCYQYILTNRCGRGTFFLFLGASIATLVTLSVSNPEEFMRIMHLPISDSLQFPLIPTIGLIILGSIVVTALICYIKKCREAEDEWYDPVKFINYSDGRNSPI